MGCDIHGWVEKEVGGKWIAVKELDYGRNYELFAELASVRGAGKAPKGLPDNVSDTAWHLCGCWGGDAHSQSHMTLYEALSCFVKHTEMFKHLIKGDRGTAMWDVFGIEAEDENYSSYRLVFWFDS